MLARMKTGWLEMLEPTCRIITVKRYTANYAASRPYAVAARGKFDPVVYLLLATCYLLLATRTRLQRLHGRRRGGLAGGKIVLRRDHVQQFHLEDQRRVRRNHRRMAALAIR